MANVLPFPARRLGIDDALPCPFCGDADVELADGGDDGEICVECAQCFAQGPLALVGCRDLDDEADVVCLEAEAVELWNGRRT